MLTTLQHWRKTGKGADHTPTLEEDREGKGADHTPALEEGKGADHTPTLEEGKSADLQAMCCLSLSCYRQPLPVLWRRAYLVHTHHPG